MNPFNALYSHVSLWLLREHPLVFYATMSEGTLWSFPHELQENLSVSDAQREGTWGLEPLKCFNLSVEVRKAEEGGMPRTHIVSLKTLDTEL